MTLKLSDPRTAGYAPSSGGPFHWLGPLEGEVGRLFRAKDWSQTPLGPVEGWPQSLRMALGICLQSRFPMLIWWGPELVMLYNDAYRPMLGDKHPRALGQDGRECWADIWPVVGPLLAAVRERGEASWSEDQRLLMTRYGYLEETYFTYSYSPIRNETGGIGGIFTAVTETTSRVIGERRLNTLRNLSIVPKQIDGPTACAAAVRVLGSNLDDLPFSLVYLASDDRQTLRLAGASGLEPGSELSPATIDLGAPSLFPIGQVLQSGTAQTFSPVPSPLAHTACVLPLADPGRGDTTGVVIAGVSPRRPLDHDYETFLKLIASHVATTVSDARAYESERRRAEALAEIDRAKTAFFSNVSHEFRTPLTLMLGPLEEAIRANGGTREVLQVAHRNSLRLLKLVNSLLDFSRIEAGRIDASYEPTDLGSFTRDLASLFRAAVEKAGLSFVVECAPLPEPVYVDRDMWEKIVFNLLSNALKFTFAGRITVRVRATAAAVGAKGGTPTPPARTVVLEVADTGTGIPPEEQSRIFERFHRVRNARSRSHEGTGIGLALVQELARLHGGHVTVESTVGAGTVFTVSVPLGRAHLPKEKIAAARALLRTGRDATPYVEEALRWLPGDDSDGHSAAPFESPTDVVRSEKAAGAFVLVADDNSDMRDYLRRLLVARGYDVATVTDGAAALAAVQRRAPSLILSDVMMPRMDGIGLLQALRRDPVTRAIPVILLTARAGEEARVEGVTAGADDYLTKPFGARELFARVETHVELARVRAATAQAIETARRRLHDVFMQSPAMVCVLRGPDHVVELANEQYLKVIGRADPAQVVGKPLRAAIPEIANQGFIEILDGVRRTGEPFHGVEMKVRLARTSDGRLEDVYVNFVYQPTRDADNVIDGVFVHAVDVTPQVRSRRQVEELVDRLARERDRAQASELRLRAIFDTTPECVKLVAADGTLLSINASGAAMIGAPDGDAVAGRPVFDFIAAEHRERWREFHERVCRGEKATLEFDCIGLDGARRHMATHGAPLETAEWGTVQLGLTRDVTETKRLADAQRRAEEALRMVTDRSERQRRLYDTVLSSTPDLVYVFGLDHRFTYANPALLAMWGRRWEEAVGRTCLELGYEPWHAAMHDREIDQVVATKRPIRGLVPFTGTNGRRIYDYIFVPVLNAEGTVEAVAGTTRDVTELKRTEEELERIVAERTSKLRETIGELEAFSYSIAHDLRAPLRALQGFSDVLLTEHAPRLDDEAQGYLRRIAAAGGRMDRLIQDVLNYSRIVRGEAPLEPVNVELLLRGIADTYPGLAPDKADIELHGPFPTLLGNEAMLTQVFSNLLGNAVKFVAPEVKPHLRVWSRLHGDRVLLSVRDNGIGIDPEQHRKIFEIFQQAETGYGGTGIGLAIVRKAVERMGGTVTVESALGAGSTFTLDLPRA